jgi:hypothetical protein
LYQAIAHVSRLSWTPHPIRMDAYQDSVHRFGL